MLYITYTMYYICICIYNQHTMKTHNEDTQSIDICINYDFNNIYYTCIHIYIYIYINVYINIF